MQRSGFRGLVQVKGSDYWGSALCEVIHELGMGRGSWARICGCVACWADVDSGKGGKSSLGMEKEMEGDRDVEIDR